MIETFNGKTYGSSPDAVWAANEHYKAVYGRAYRAVEGTDFVIRTKDGSFIVDMRQSLEQQRAIAQPITYEPLTKADVGLIVFLIIGMIILANACTPDRSVGSSSTSSSSSISTSTSPTSGTARATTDRSVSGQPAGKSPGQSAATMQGASRESVDNLLRTIVTEGLNRAPKDQHQHFEMDKP